MNTDIPEQYTDTDGLDISLDPLSILPVLESAKLLPAVPSEIPNYVIIRQDDPWREISVSPFPAHWQVDVARLRPSTNNTTDLRAATHNALEHPLGTLPLIELLASAKRVAVAYGGETSVMTDVLDVVLGQSYLAGLLAEQVSLLVPSIEIAQQVQPMIHDRATLVINDSANDWRDFDNLGNVEGVPLSVHHVVTDADLVIGIYAVQPEIYSAYTSPATSLIKTTSSAATQKELTDAKYLAQQLSWNGRVQELPLQRIAQEMAKRAGLSFCMGVLPNNALLAGEPFAVRDATLPVAQNLRQADVCHDDYDIIFAEMDQPPQSVYNAFAAVAALGNMPASPLLHGGVLVIHADEPATAPSPDAQHFYDAMTMASDAHEVLTLLGRGSLNTGQVRAFAVATALQHCKVILVGQSEATEDLARACHAIPARDLQEAYDLAESLAGRLPKSLAVSQAVYALPVFSNRFAESETELHNGWLPNSF